VKLGNPLPNPVITNQVQHAIRDRPQAACKPCRTPAQNRNAPEVLCLLLVMDTIGKGGLYEPTIRLDSTYLCVG
jgi:hypothetical protein